MGLATVYRNLRVLQQAGRVRCRHLPSGELLYSPLERDVHHLTCLECSFSQPLTSCPVQQQGLKLPTRGLSTPVPHPGSVWVLRQVQARMTNDSSAIALEAKAVSHCFGSQAVLDSINLSCGKEAAALIGPNGAGKSTLLHVLQGLLKPSEGDVVIGGTAVASCRHRIALMPQRGASIGRFRLPP